MDICKGDINGAYTEFCNSLAKFRKIVPIETICMHGSPLSKFDNRTLWEYYDYWELGIIGEPYLDLDFNKIFYLTDTGRRFDGFKVSIRDKVVVGCQTNWPIYKSIEDIIKAMETGTFPYKVMLTLHPQRWTSNFFLWIKEFVLQQLKNVIKKVILLQNMKRA